MGGFFSAFLVSSGVHLLFLPVSLWLYRNAICMKYFPALDLLVSSVGSLYSQCSEINENMFSDQDHPWLFFTSCLQADTVSGCSSMWAVEEPSGHCYLIIYVDCNC